MKRNLVRRKLREEEQQAIGAIYKQYIDTFQDNVEIPKKTFVKSDTLYAENGTKTSEKGQLYNPQPLIKLKKPEVKKPPPHSTLPPAKKKSNLKALGDELKLLQQERQVKEVKLMVPQIDPSPSLIPDNDYANSTNLFVSNLSPHITEKHLIQIFGTYGPLASVKIMWPRNEVNCRNVNCGFVAFMSRLDAERALSRLKNHKDMKINWGKSVKIPAHPIHIPPELYKLYSPPPPSGLPFNAQIADKTNKVDLSKTTVKVTIPFDRNILMLIHRTIEFVVREGPEFEAIIMNIESGNPDFRFLSDFSSPNHSYYRWKLYSILHGDPKNSWSMQPFRMYKNGSIWMPPTALNYKDGMPKDLISNKKEDSHLSEAQADRLIVLIKNLTMSRLSIGEAMVYCINHSNASEDVLRILIESLTNQNTNILKKIARIYLLTDLMFNCKIRKIPLLINQDDFFNIFKQLHSIYTKLKHSQDKTCLKSKIFSILRSWLIHNFYDVKFVTKLENIFLFGNEVSEDDDSSFTDEPLDGANLLKRSLGATTTDCTIVKNDNKKTKKEKFFDIFNPTS